MNKNVKIIVYTAAGVLVALIALIIVLIVNDNHNTVARNEAVPIRWP